jgi:hypothetical protein
LASYSTSAVEIGSRQLSQTTIGVSSAPRRHTRLLDRRADRVCLTIPSTDPQRAVEAIVVGTDGAGLAAQLVRRGIEDVVGAVRDQSWHERSFQDQVSLAK